MSSTQRLGHVTIRTSSDDDDGGGGGGGGGEASASVVSDLVTEVDDP